MGNLLKLLMLSCALAPTVIAGSWDEKSQAEIWWSGKTAALPTRKCMEALLKPIKNQSHSESAAGSSWSDGIPQHPGHKAEIWWLEKTASLPTPESVVAILAPIINGERTSGRNQSHPESVAFPRAMEITPYLVATAVLEEKILGPKIDKLLSNRQGRVQSSLLQ